MRDVTIEEHDYRGIAAVALVLTYAGLLLLGRVAEAAAVGPWVGLILEKYFRTGRKTR